MTKVKKIINKIAAAVLFFSMLGETVGVYAEDNAELGSVEGITKVVLACAGKNYAYVRGLQREVCVPFFENGIAYMAVRDLADAEVSPIEWNNYTKKAEVTYLKYKLSFSDRSNVMTVKDEALNTETIFTMPGNAINRNGTMFIPAESFAEVTDKIFYTDGNVIVYGRDYFGKDSIAAASRKNLSVFFEKEYNPDFVMKYLYVDPDKGKDDNIGTSDKPMASIDGARKYIREYKQTHEMTGDIIVYLRGGEYVLQKAVEFEYEDSGENGYNIRYMAYPGEKSIVTTGKTIDDWECVDEEKNIYKAYVGLDVKSQIITENGEYAIPARYPNDGFLHAQVSDKGISVRNMKIKKEDIPDIASYDSLRIALYGGREEGFVMWDKRYHKIINFDLDTGEIILDTDSTQPIGTGSSYYYENAYEFIDEPGEFYIKDGYIFYKPRNEDINKSKICYPSSEGILSLVSNTATEKIHNIKFSDIEFMCVDRAVDAITLIDSCEIVFDSCYFHDMGGSAVKIEGNSMTNSIINSSVVNVGGGGILVESHNYKANEVLLGYNKIYNNIVKNVGFYNSSNGGIGVARSEFNYVGHNTVAFSPRFGINMSGLTQQVRFEVEEDKQFDYAVGRGNVVEYNDVYKCMTETQDGAPIYGWCLGINNVCRGNKVSGSSIQASYGNMIYFDDQCWKTSIYNNVVVDNQKETTDGEVAGIFLVKGVNNTVTNNVAVNNGWHEGYKKRTAFLFNCNTSTIASYDLTVKNNVQYNSGEDLFRITRDTGWSTPDKRMKESDFNTFYNDRGIYNLNIQDSSVQNLDDYLVWNNSKYDQNSLIGVDPKFIDVDNGDLRFAYDSEVYGIGTQDIDYSEIGLVQYNKYADNQDGVNSVYVYNPYTGENSKTALKSGEQLSLAVKAKRKDTSCIDIDKCGVSFVSSNIDVASVDNFGVVNALNRGVSTITITVEYGGKTVSTNFTVTVDDEIQDVFVNIPGDRFVKGDTRQMFIKYQTMFGCYGIPKNVKYTSSDTRIAEVSDNGEIRFIEDGTAVITVTAEQNGKIFTKEKEIIVKSVFFDDFTLKLDGKRVLSPDDSSKLIVSAFDSQGNECEVLDECVTFKSDDGLEVSGEKGEYYVKVVNKGIHKLTVEYFADGNVRRRELYFAGIDNDTEDNEWKVSTYDADWALSRTDNKKTYGDGTVYESGYFEFETTGFNLWLNADSGSFMNKLIKLDKDNPRADIIVEVYKTPHGTWEDRTTNCLAQLGVTMRESDTPESKNVTFRWGDARPFTWRSDDSGTYSYIGTNVGEESYQWLRIIRNGNEFTGYYKVNEQDEWICAGTCTVDMSADMYVGISGYSNTADSKIVSGIGKVTVKTGNEIGEGIE